MSFFEDGLMTDLPADDTVMDPNWLNEWSPEWSAGSVELENLRLLSASPISETSLLSDEIGLLVEDTGMDVIDVKPSPLGELSSATPMVPDTVEPQVTKPKPARKPKRESGTRGRRANSPKPASRKPAAAAVGATPSANSAAAAAVRSGSFFEILTEEERGLMEAEGITVPKKGPLSKASERELKRLRRQVKNKYSAKDSRKKRKEYMDGLEQTNAELSDQLSASRRENTALKSKLRSVQTLFKPAAKASASLASKTRKSAMLLLCLLFSRQQHGFDLGSVTGLSDLIATSGHQELFKAEAWSSDEGTSSPVEDADMDLPDWMTKGVDGPLGSSVLSDSQANGVLEAARSAAAEFLKRDSLAAAPSPPVKVEATAWPHGLERLTAAQ